MSKNRPPRWSTSFLRTFLKKEYLEEIEGDLEEGFIDALEKYSLKKARRRYSLEVIKLIRPILMKGKINIQKLEIMTTLVHSYRNFRKKPIFSILNTLGFSLGIFALIIIVTYLHKESRYDKFHANSDRVVRVNKHVLNLDGSIEDHALTSGPMAMALEKDYPAVEKAIHVLPWFNDETIEYNEIVLKSKHLLFVDKSFFEVFDFDLIQGDLNSALQENRSIILSSELSRNLFGTSSPLGKVVKGFKNKDFEVSGVAQNRSDSHIQFDAIIPIDMLEDAGIDWLDRWYPQMVFTYLLLKDPEQKEALQEQMGDFMHKYFPQKEEQYQLYFQDFESIYAYSEDLLYNRKMKAGSHRSQEILWVVAIVILTLVLINFINLSSVGKAINAKSIIIKNLLGASRGNLFQQLMLEAMAKILFAIILAALGIFLFRNRISSFIEGWDISDIYNPWIIGICIGLMTIIPLIAAFYLSRSSLNSQVTNPANSFAPQPSTSVIRNSLVVLQFLLSSTIISVTFFNHQQLKFISNFDLGYTPESVLTLNLDGPIIQTQALAFKNELLAHPSIKNVALSRNVPGFEVGTYGIEPEGVPKNENLTAAVFMLGDYDFQKAYGLEMVEGRFFSEEILSDKSGVIINEKLMNDLAWTDPIGKKLDIPGEFGNGRVIGVVKNFHTKSLHLPVEPMVLIVTERRPMASIQISDLEMQDAIATVDKVWNQFEPNYPMELFVLENITSNMYLKERSFFRVLTFFSMLTIAIAGLGQLGLMYYLVNRRLKELSIRKILGASLLSLMKELSMKSQLLILLGFLISIPISYFIVNKQLESYAYSISIGIVPFFVLGASIMTLAWLISSFQTYKASCTNPVDILRSE